MPTNDVSEWQRAGLVGGQRVNTRGPQRGGQIAADSTLDRFQVSISPCFTLDTTNPTSPWLPQPESSTSTCNLACTLVWWTSCRDLRQQYCCQTEPSDVSDFRPLSSENLSLMKLRLYFISEIMTWLQDWVFSWTSVSTFQAARLPVSVAWAAAGEALQLWRPRAGTSGFFFSKGKV